MGNNLKTCCTEGGNELLLQMNYGEEENYKKIKRNPKVDKKQDFINNALASNKFNGKQQRKSRSIDSQKNKRSNKIQNENEMAKDA